MKTRITQMRLTADEIDLLDQLTEIYGQSTRTDTVRAMIRWFRLTLPELKITPKKIPKKVSKTA